MSPLTSCPGVTTLTPRPGHSPGRGPRTRPCHPNHHRTTSQPGQPPPRSEPAGELPAGAAAADAGEFFEGLAAVSPRWLLTRGQRRRLGPAIAGALAAGWTPGGLADVAGAKAAGIRNPAAVLAARLAPA